jgi:hypothetical protein
LLRTPPARGSSSGEILALPEPIQQFFAKLEHWFRKVAARAADAVCDAVGHIRATVTSAACTNYFAHAGYEQT